MSNLAWKRPKTLSHLLHSGARHLFTGLAERRRASRSVATMRKQGAPAAAACLPLCLAASRLAPPRPSARAALASSLASPSPLSLPASRFAPRRDTRPPWASRLSLPPPRPRCLRVSPSAPLPSQSCAAPPSTIVRSPQPPYRAVAGAPVAAAA